MKRKIWFIGLIVEALGLFAEESFNFQLSPSTFNLDDIVLDIYNAATELGEVDYEQLQNDLYALHDAPIDLNHTSDEELSQLYFLSPRQIDDILMFADKHPFQSLYELRMIPSLEDYEIRDLLPFVTTTTDNNSLPFREGSGLGLYPKEIFRDAKHEILTRVDARNIEMFEGMDPMYVQTRYKFDYRRRVTFGAQLRRPAGGDAGSLQYGAYLQLRDIAPHLHTLVAGNFQASFGQGLVLAPVFRSGRSAYVASVGQTVDGLRYYSSVDGEGLHGAGATLRWEWNKTTRLDVSALYSMKRANDSVWHHLVGANMTVRHKRFQAQLTAIENIWTDSIHPYRNTTYNQHYFRGRNQFVLGASFRYNHGWFDAFAEVATAQNYKRFEETINSEEINSAHWGFGTIIGNRFYPTSGVSLIALYRYYSPFFDNALGYAFSETSRIGDENGGYIGFEISRSKNWRFSGYGDIFYFSGPKYGIPQSPTLGYDALFETQYHKPLNANLSTLSFTLRLRARQKGNLSTYSARAQFDWSRGAWSLRTTADANMTHSSSNTLIPSSSNPLIPYGVSIAQDVAFDLTPYTLRHTPVSFRFRLQFFDARDWNNRIYMYEHDVLYAFSIPAVYGLGGRAYMCLRWQIIPQLALYFRFSETLYARDWYVNKHPEWLSSAHRNLPLPSRTDFHLLLRATL